MRASVSTLVGAVMCCALFASCAKLSVNSVPFAGNNYDDGYNIVAEFVNVLNLPDRAKVVMDGTDVGVVTDVAIVGDHVDVTARIDPKVTVPANVHAVLQQATVLGDIYLAFERTEEGAPALSANGRIPMPQTTSPPQLEDTIANLANFIGSGSIQRAQNSLIRINSVTPPKPDVRRVVTQVTADLRDLSENIDNVDLLLESVAQTATVLGNRTPALSTWFSQQGIGGFARDMVLANTFGRLLPSIGSIYNNGYWLVPLLRSLTGAIGAIQGSKQAVEAEYPKYRDFINNYFLPQDKYPAINITSIVGPDGRELSGNVEQVLRMLGAVP